MLNREQTNQFYQLWNNDDDKYYHHCTLYHIEGQFVAYDLTALDIIRTDNDKPNVIKVLGYFEPFNPKLSSAELKISFLYHPENNSWILWSIDFLQDFDFNHLYENEKSYIPFSNVVFD